MHRSFFDCSGIVSPKIPCQHNSPTTTASIMIQKQGIQSTSIFLLSFSNKMATPTLSSHLTRHVQPAQVPVRTDLMSRNSSTDQPRRTSVVSVKDYVDIDKLIGDIKISPIHTNLSIHLKAIFAELKYFKNVPQVQDEVATVEMLLRSIEKKIGHTRNKSRESSIPNSIKKEIICQKANLAASSQSKNIIMSYNHVSPIKQLQEGSRILYTNFSLSELKSSKMISPEKISILVEEDQQQNRLAREISTLQKMLQRKGLSANARPDSKKEWMVKNAMQNGKLGKLGLR